MGLSPPAPDIDTIKNVLKRKLIQRKKIMCLQTHNS